MFLPMWIFRSSNQIVHRNLKIIRYFYQLFNTWLPLSRFITTNGILRGIKLCCQS